MLPPAPETGEGIVQNIVYPMHSLLLPYVDDEGHSSLFVIHAPDRLPEGRWLVDVHHYDNLQGHECYNVNEPGTAADSVL